MVRFAGSVTVEELSWTQADEEGGVASAVKFVPPARQQRSPLSLAQQSGFVQRRLLAVIAGVVQVLVGLEQLPSHWTPAIRAPHRHQPLSVLKPRRSPLVAGAVAEGARQQDAVILADACVGAARRIMTELLAQRAGVPRGRA